MIFSLNHTNRKIIRFSLVHWLNNLNNYKVNVSDTVCELTKRNKIGDSVKTCIDQCIKSIFDLW